MNSGELKRAKKVVRTRVLAIRDAMTPEDRERCARAVCERVLSLPEVIAARVVMVFSTFGSELPTGPILEGLARAEKTVALPRVVDADLEVRTWTPGAAMTPTRFGALEPAGGEVLSPEDVDVVLTPAVAFDRAGARVGYGGGFYDRFFPKTRATRIGVGFALQLLDEPLPGGPFDLPVEVVVTEGEVVRPSP